MSNENDSKIKSQNELSALGLKGAFGSVGEQTTTPQLSKESQDAFEQAVHEKLMLSLRARSTIRPLLHTKETFSHSVSDIFDYLQDCDVCGKCPGNYLDCPKHGKGYQLYPVYDKTADRILLRKTCCKIMTDTTAIADRIVPSVLPVTLFLTDSKQMMDWIRNPKNGKQLKDSLAFFAGVLKLSKSLTKETPATGFAIYSINGHSLSQSLLESTAFFYAKSGHTVSYMNMASLLSGMGERQPDPDSDGVFDFRKACAADCLCIQDIDVYPYLTTELKQALRNLFTERSKKGRITYMTLTKDADGMTLARYFFYGLEDQGDMTERFSLLFRKKIIHDLPL